MKTAYHLAREVIESMPDGKQFTSFNIVDILCDMDELYEHSTREIKRSVNTALMFLKKHQVVKIIQKQKPYLYEKTASKDIPSRRQVLSAADRLLAMTPTEIGKGFVALVKSKDKEINKLCAELRSLKEDYDSMSDQHYDCQMALTKCKEQLIQLRKETE